MSSRQSLDALTDAILTQLAACPDLVESLIAETGIAPSGLRRLAADPTTAFASAMVDFICTTDDRLIAFSAASGWPAAEVERMRQMLEAGILR